MTKNIFTTTLPNLLSIQQSSYCWFLTKGLGAELRSFPLILDCGDKRELRFFMKDYVLRIKKNRTAIKAKQENVTYGFRIYIPIQITNYLSREKYKKQFVFIGQIPLMTNKCTFIVNGCEKVIVNQIIRSPGLYYKIEFEKKQIVQILTLISHRGSWINFEFDKDGCWIRIDKSEPSPIFDFFHYLDLKEDELNFGLKSKFIIEYYKDHQEFLKSEKEKAYLSDNDLKFICSMFFTKEFFDLGKIGRKNLNERLGLQIPKYITTLTLEDIFAIIDYFQETENYLPDEIDDLRNRRIRSVGESILNQFTIGLIRLKKTTLEKAKKYKEHLLSVSLIINAKPIISVLKEFFGSSQLSQYLDQINPLSELANKRRISSLGPGGLSSDHVAIEVRDLHPSQYGKICPIETPEGQNVGLVGTLASYARVNEEGFIETPYFTVENGRVLIQKKLTYLTAKEEENFKIAASDIKISKNGFIKQNLIHARINQEIMLVETKELNFVSISPIQMISIGTALIPFLEHDDANRALMGANMQRQAVPLLKPQRPIVGTGLELQIATDSGLALVAIKSGIVVESSNCQIKIKDSNHNILKYSLIKYQRSNQDTCINQKPVVWVGEHIKAGQIIADSSAMDNGELALGQNLLVAYMPWEGYNYEDAVLISDKLIYQNLFTSIHIEKYETEIEATDFGSEIITRDIPQVPVLNLENLDKNGIIKEGSFVKPGDILVGKVAPKDESDELPEARLLKAIFGYTTPNVVDTSLYVPNGVSGRILNIKLFKLDKKTQLPTTNSVIRIFIAEIRKVKLGDKISGRHGNKGVISKIVPHMDMPYLPDGRTIDIILNPLGVPSRMNVGQIFECLLGLAGNELNKRFKILPFDEMYETEASRILVNNKLREAAKKSKKDWLFNYYYPGKIFITDGRTGEKFQNPVLVGKAYILKLVHLVDDKIHARSTGPYSIVTQQPVGGRSQGGGQRFGEMEVWALEAFGSAYTLQELLTVKSDDMDGREEVLNCIIRNEPIPKSGIPESFKVLVSELQALGLNIRSYKLKKTKQNSIKSLKIDLMKTYENLVN